MVNRPQVKQTHGVICFATKYRISGRAIAKSNFLLLGVTDKIINLVRHILVAETTFDSPIIGYRIIRLDKACY